MVILNGASESLRKGIIRKMIIEVHESVPSVNLKDIVVLLRKMIM